MTEIAIMADPHIGNTRWPVPATRYNAPVIEFVNYCLTNSIDLAIIAGDLFHQRNPTQQAISQARWMLGDLDDRLRIVAGNHDTFVRPGSPSGVQLVETHYKGDLYEPWIENRTDVAIVYLPWPHYRTFERDEGAPGADASIADKLQFAAERTYAGLERCLEWTKRNEPYKPTLLVGHAHVYYGDSWEQARLPESPRLLAGRDVLLSFKWLTDHFDRVALGHIHDAGSKGYVGSTQPTDFADTGVKGFVHLSFTSTGITHTWIPYKSSLKVKHWQLTQQDEIDVAAEHVDIGKLTVQLDQDSTLTHAQAQQTLQELCDIPMGVTLVPAARKRRTEELGLQDVDFSSVPEALGAWAASKELDPAPLLQELERIGGE